MIADDCVESQCSDFYVISREYGSFQSDTLTVNITYAYFGAVERKPKESDLPVP